MSSLMSLAGPRTRWSPGICRSNLFKVATGQKQIHWQMSARVLNDVFSVLTPPPALTPEEYDGWEYRWKFFVFRPACNFIQIMPYDWIQISLSTVLTTEGYLLAGLLFYCLFAFWGSSTNSKKAKNWRVITEILPSLTVTNVSVFHSGWQNTFQYTSNNSLSPSKRMAWY